MMAWTKARKFPGVRWCTSKTMAALPLYLIAIPFRRSFAAAIGFVEEELKRLTVMRSADVTLVARQINLEVTGPNTVISSENAGPARIRGIPSTTLGIT